MKRLLITTIFVLFGVGLWAVPNDTSKTVKLELRGGAGYGLYRDLGLSPLTYKGIELLPGMAVQVSEARWRRRYFVDLDGGGYGLRVGVGYMQAYGGYCMVGVEGLCRVLDRGVWSVWGGGSVRESFDFRYNSSFGNSSTGMTNCAALGLAGRVECELGRWRLHGQVDLLPLTLLLRPGFAYMDNYDQDISSATANALDQYHSYVSGLPGVDCDFGATLGLRNGNGVTIGYVWHFFTSHTSGEAAPYSFEQASHGLRVILNFKI